MHAFRLAAARVSRRQLGCVVILCEKRFDIHLLAQSQCVGHVRTCVQRTKIRYLCVLHIFKKPLQNAFIRQPIALPGILRLPQRVLSVPNLPVRRHILAVVQLGQLLLIALYGGGKGLDLALQLRDLGLGVGILLAVRLGGVQLLEKGLGLPQGALGGGQVALGEGDLLVRHLVGVPLGVGSLQVLPEGLHALVVGLIALEQLQAALFIGELGVGQSLLRRAELLALHVAQDEQKRPLFDGIAFLHAHGANLPGLLEVHLVALVGRQGAAAADLRVDGPGGHHLGSHLGEGIVHDRLREKGQHQQHRQKHDGDGLDEFPLFGFFLHFHRCIVLSLGCGGLVGSPCGK